MDWSGQSVRFPTNIKPGRFPNEQFFFLFSKTGKKAGYCEQGNAPVSYKSH
jgi:hypothetical protein